MSNTSTPSFGVVYPLWNHVREPGNLLDRLVGEVGIDHITIPVVTGPIEQFRPFYFPDAPYFGTEGGLHYPPGPQLSSVARAHVAVWCRKRDVLSQVRAEADRHGVRLYLQVLPRYVPHLATDHPHLAAFDPWGQSRIDPRPCASNPIMREWVEVLFADLTRYEPAGFEFEHLAFDDIGIIPSLWSWDQEDPEFIPCFCAACRQLGQSAGIDVERLALAFRQQVLHCYARGRGRGQGDSAVRIDRDALLQYKNARASSLAKWGSSLAEAHRAVGRHFLTAIDNETNWRREDEPAHEDLASPGTLRAVRRSLWHDDARSASNLVVFVMQAIEAHFQFFDFEGIESGSPELVTSLKQAIRYARRA